jgi:hypothetical protein
MLGEELVKLVKPPRRGKVRCNDGGGGREKLWVVDEKRNVRVKRVMEVNIFVAGRRRLELGGSGWQGR